MRGLRARDGLSQDYLAARAYVSRQTISSWENARTHPDVQSILLLALLAAAVGFLCSHHLSALLDALLG